MQMKISFLYRTPPTTHLQI